MLFFAKGLVIGDKCCNVRPVTYLLLALSLANNWRWQPLALIAGELIHSASKDEFGLVWFVMMLATYNA